MPQLLFQHIYIEEYISGIQKSEFQEGKNIGNLMAGYFWSLMVFVFVGLFLKMSFFKVWCYLKKNYSMNFNGRRTKLLKMYSSMVGRVGNIKKKKCNKFKMLKITKNHKNY